jgi:hypothetical protein
MAGNALEDIGERYGGSPGLELVRARRDQRQFAGFHRLVDDGGVLEITDFLAFGNPLPEIRKKMAGPTVESPAGAVAALPVSDEQAKSRCSVARIARGVCAAVTRTKILSKIRRLPCARIFLHSTGQGFLPFPNSRLGLAAERIICFRQMDEGLHCP